MAGFKRQLETFTQLAVLLILFSTLCTEEAFSQSASRKLAATKVERQKSIDSLRKKLAQVAGKGNADEVDVRYDLAKELQDAEQYEAATDQYVWLWKNIEKADPAMMGVRSSYMTSRMQDLCSDYAPAREPFTKLRDEAQQSNLGDWITLNTVIDEDSATIDWFEKVKDDKKEQKIYRDHAYQLRRLLYESPRWRDIVYLYDDPLIHLKEVHDTDQEMKKRLHGYYKNSDRLPVEAAELYTVYLAAHRKADVDRIVNEALKLDNSSAMRASLIQGGLHAREVSPIYIQWIWEMGYAGKIFFAVLLLGVFFSVASVVGLAWLVIQSVSKKKPAVTAA